jgi:hypothetical protein
MVMFPLTLSFHDSEVKQIRREQHIVYVVFSAARVHSDEAVAPSFSGYALGLELQLTGVMGALPPLDCFGRLSGGRMAVGGPARSSLVLPGLPFEWTGQTQLELTFGQGDAWTACALGVRFDWENEARFLEESSC